MKKINVIRLSGIRDELDALGTLMEHEIPQELTLDIIAKTVEIIDEVISDEVDLVEPVDRRKIDPTFGKEIDIANTVTLYRNLFNSLKNLED